MSVEDGKYDMHPPGMKKRPSHEWQEGHLRSDTQQGGNKFTVVLLTPKESVHREYIVSARTEKGPVTPKMVSGWMENLVASRNILTITKIAGIN